MRRSSIIVDVDASMGALHKGEISPDGYQLQFCVQRYELFRGNSIYKSRVFLPNIVFYFMLLKTSINRRADFAWSCNSNVES